MAVQVLLGLLQNCLGSRARAILANISAREFIQAGHNVMIGGFISVSQSAKLVVRAIGPSLTQFGINNALLTHGSSSMMVMAPWR